MNVKNKLKIALSIIDIVFKLIIIFLLPIITYYLISGSIKVDSVNYVTEVNKIGFMGSKVYTEILNSDPIYVRGFVGVTGEVSIRDKVFVIGTVDCQ